MTIDARTATPEPSLQAATLLSRTRLAQRECAARLGISERTLRYHLTGRPMSYALRCLFESLALECEAAHRTAEAWRRKYGGRLADKLAQFAKGYASPTEYLPEVGSPRRFLREALDAIGPCRLKIRDLTCAEAANPWARTVAAYNAALYGMDFAKVEARAKAYAESQPHYTCPRCFARQAETINPCDQCGYRA